MAKLEADDVDEPAIQGVWRLVLLAEETAKATFAEAGKCLAGSCSRKQTATVYRKQRRGEGSRTL